MFGLANILFDSRQIQPAKAAIDQNKVPKRSWTSVEAMIVKSPFDCGPLLSSRVTPPDPSRARPGVGIPDTLSDVHAVAMHGSWGGPGRVTGGTLGDSTRGDGWRR
jgi:hypothetical protein